MKKKKILGLFLLAIILSTLSCNKNPTGFDLSQYEYGTWQLQRQSENDGNYWDLFFIDKENGWATGSNGKIIHTTNGGTNWEFQKTPINKLVYSISFINKNEGWACGENKILHTTNSGLNWSVAFTDTEKSKFGATDSSFKYYQKVYFKDELYGWALNESGELKHTSDGGRNWIKQIEWEYGGPSHISFVNSETGYLLTMRNELLTTNNGGNSWITKGSCNIKFSSYMKFLDESEGWIVTQYALSNYWTNGSPIYKTIDGGKSWQFVDTIYDYILTSIDFVREKGWITGSNGIYQSIDYGKTWKVYNEFYNKYFFIRVFAIDEKNVWALDFTGRIFKYIPN